MRVASITTLLTLTQAYDNGAENSKMPPLGWSSWVALGKGWPGPEAQHPAFDFCDEASVKASIDAFSDVGLYDAGYRHFHLDDCWADLERNATGFLQAERDHFPNGMKPLVDYAHSKGLSYGLYTCAGTYTCVGKRPGSKGHFAQDAAVFAEWGVDVVKMDWCNTEGMDPKTTYTQMSQALNKTGRHIHFNMCEWGRDNPWEWGPDVAQSWRATGDHTPVWSSTKAIIAQRTKIPQSLGGAPFAWNDMDMIETGNYKQAAHANGKQGTMTETEYKTEFSMWAIFASPLVVTTPILNCSSTDAMSNFTPATCKAELTDLQKEILLNKEVIAVNQDVTPAGHLLSSEDGNDIITDCAMTEQISVTKCTFGETYGCFADNASMWIQGGCRGVFECDGVAGVHCDHNGGAFTVCDCVPPVPKPAMIYARNLSDGSVAVALYNPEDVDGWASLDLELIGFTTARVRDLWAHKDLGTFIGHYPEAGNVTVEAHGTTMLRISSASTVV